MEGKKGQSNLERALSVALERRKKQSTLRKLTTYSPDSIDFSSNDFISLAQSNELREAFLKELNAESTTFPLGSGGSRLLDGNSIYAENLERDIAAFHGAPGGLLCNSGFDANVGLFSCLPQPGDVVIYDEYIHASVHDGMRASRVKNQTAFTHNSVPAFRETLQKFVDGEQGFRTGTRNVFIALEAIYSMDGDVAPLKEIADVVEELLPQGNGHIIVDEAHSTGVLGPNGRGLVSELGLEDRVSIRLHTFGKAMACNGGEFKIIFDSHAIDADEFSDYPLQAINTTIPGQLCQATHIYHLPIIPRSSRYQSVLFHVDRWKDKRIAGETVLTNLASLRLASGLAACREAASSSLRTRQLPA